jgi:hypothetical protein
VVDSPNLSSFIWSVADLLRGDFKQSEYGRVILPFTVLRRLDCVLEPTKKAVLAERAARKKAGLNPEPFLLKKARQLFYNTSPLDKKTLVGDPDRTASSAAGRSRSSARCATKRAAWNVPLSEAVEAYSEREVRPHAPDAWIDHEKTKVGYEIPFNRHFYVFKPPRALAEIDAGLKVVTDRIVTMIGGLSK